MKFDSLVARAIVAVGLAGAPMTVNAAIGVQPTRAFELLNTAANVASIFADDAPYEVASSGKGRDGNGGRRDNDDDDDDDDDRGRDRDRSSNDRDRSSNDRDRNEVSGSGRDRPRIPGGSGCDDAHDIAEHAACRP